MFLEYAMQKHFWTDNFFLWDTLDMHTRIYCWVQYTRFPVLSKSLKPILITSAACRGLYRGHLQEDLDLHIFKRKDGHLTVKYLFLEIYWMYNLQHTQFSKQDRLWTCMMPVFSETGVLCRPCVTWDIWLCIYLNKIRKKYDTISIQCSFCDLFRRLFWRFWRLFFWNIIVALLRPLTNNN